MNYQRFKNIRTMQDIKLEKAKIRYEMMMAENQLMDSFNAIERLVVITTFIKRFAAGFSAAQNFIRNFHHYIEKFMFWKKDKGSENSEKEKDSKE